MTVDAAFATTWDAVIDHFAENNIPIATIERESGIVATTELSVDRAVGEASSDCGTGRGLASDMRFHGTSAIYNVLVRGDERASTVRVTVSWFNSNAGFECVTTGTWESEAESAIRARAEG